MKKITKDKYKITFNPRGELTTSSVVSGNIIRLLLRECGFSYHEIDGGLDLKDITKSMNIKRIKNE